MLLLHRPSPERIRRFLDSQEREPFSYARVGATRGAPPAGFTVDHNRARLGTGRVAFDHAKEAVRQWRMFDLGWLAIHGAEATIHDGQVVAVQGSHYGFWSLNACRVVYLVDEAERFGFAYGTLTKHAEIGEERFTVELREGEVWYDVFAFSRPRMLARLGYPLSRALQKRFVRDSIGAMSRAARSAGQSP